MVRAMEANPEVGILQTQPIYGSGKFAFSSLPAIFQPRLRRHFFPGQQHGTNVLGVVLGSHNAIIPHRPPSFEYLRSDLPALPVPDRGKRHVLSHDTVEAALMRRAGYEVWIAYDEPGSYEEGPPNLSDMLKRDRRWCAGNLQHFWFLFARDIEMGSRLQIWIGLMAYLCSPLWLVFLLAGSFSAYFRMRFLMLSADPEALGEATSSGAVLLFIITLVLLFTPRSSWASSLPFLPRRKQYSWRRIPHAHQCLAGKSYFPSPWHPS